MNSKVYVITTVLLALIVNSAQADGLSLGEVKMNAGTQKTVDVTLTQDAERFAGFQFDVLLPDGVLLADCALVEEQTGDMVYEKEEQVDGSVRFIVYSPSLKSVRSGKVMVLHLKADKKAIAGNYEMKLGNIMVSDADGNVTNINETTSLVTIVPPVKITAKNAERCYGEKNGTLDYEISENYTTGTPTIECEADEMSSVGTYPIILGQGNIEADTVTIVNGMLTITKASLTISAGTYTRKQGEENPVFSAQFEGFKNGETSEVLTKQPVLSCDATAASVPGEYAVTVEGAEAGNYDISYVHGKLIVIDADDVVIMAKSYTREYGEENPTFGYTVEGAALDGEPVIECEASATSAVGTYDIIIKKGGVTNYNDTYVNGTLTITKALLKVTVKDVEREQGEENPQFEIVYEGWKQQDTESVLTKKPVAMTTAEKDSPAGVYDITVSGGEAENYELAYQSGRLTVTVPSGIVEITSGKLFDIYTSSGVLVKKNTSTLKGLSRGVYIINSKKLIVK